MAAFMNRTTLAVAAVGGTAAALYYFRGSKLHAGAAPGQFVLTTILMCCILCMQARVLVCHLMKLLGQEVRMPTTVYSVHLLIL